MLPSRTIERLPKTAQVVVPLLAIACGGSPPERAPARPETEAAARERPPDQGREEAPRELPPGVLAEVEGIQGTIRVTEEYGVRKLEIGGAVQGAIPVGAGESLRPPDPLAGLVEALRPGARDALVIGLGTGATAQDLAALDLRVLAVELEPEVIELARRYFDFEGKAVAGDGLEYLQNHEDKYDLFVVDAATHGEPPEHLVGAESFALMRHRSREKGLVLVRLTAEPRAPAIARLRSRLRRELESPYVLVFGGGVGAEEQDLVLAGSPKPLNFVDAPGVPLWPVRLEGESAAWAEPTPPRGREPDAGAESRRVALVGYVIRLGDGTVALDLPHRKKGAIRYQLLGRATEELEALLPRRTRFPTDGGIPSDGDTSRTLRDVLGGTGAERSDLRFSPVIAALEGAATLRSVVHPDAASNVPASLRDGAETDDRIPYGGALYDLEISRLYWTFDRRGWKAMRRRLEPLVRRAIRRIERRGDLAAAEKALSSYKEAFEKRFALFPERLSLFRQMRALVLRLREEVRRLGGSEDPFALAAACDRAAGEAPRAGALSGDVAAARDALLERARRGYREAADSGGADGRRAAARLLHFFEGDRLDGDGETARAASDEIEELLSRYPDLEADEEPPAP